MKDAHNVYDDADRVEITDDEGTITWVVLADERIDGVAYALAADQSELEGPVEEMSIAVFCTSGHGYERQLTMIEDEDTENRVFAHFSELMGLEGA